MKLLYSQTSPFVRKVMMVLHETGQTAQVEIIPSDVYAADTPVIKANPLSKIPALVMDDGSTLIDSPVICEYLDSRHDGPKLFPISGPARWTALRQQALADGICDASVLRRMEMMRPEAMRSGDWDLRQRRAVSRALDWLDQAVDELASVDALTIGSLSVMAALGYLDFRFGSEGWRQGRSSLAGWFASVASRPSFTLTGPPTE